MNTEIRKYRLEIAEGVQLLQLSIAAKILFTHIQGERLYIWVEVDPSAQNQERRFMVVGTGWVLPEPREYIGTVQEHPYMWHVYALPLAASV